MNQQPLAPALDPEEQLAARNRRPPLFTTILLVAVGAAVGANARYFLSTWVAAHWGSAFPYGTLVVNLTGCVAIGIVLGLAATHPGINAAWRLLLVTGLLGGFTTFSSFGYETYDLLVSGAFAQVAAYVFGSVGLGLLGVFAGVGIARALG